VGLLDPPSRFEVAADLPPPPPDSRNPCEWVRDDEGLVWLRKKLTWDGLVGEAVAVEVADRFGVEIAEGAVDLASRTWFSLKLDRLSWDPVHGPRVEVVPLARMILFDLALGISDRHWGNVLLRPIGDQFWPIGIDHELAVVAYQGSMAVPSGTTCRARGCPSPPSSEICAQALPELAPAIYPG
jgi:hypothetical protein